MPAELVFDNHRDIALLGLDFGLLDPNSGAEDRRRAAADAAFDASPKLQTIASTAFHIEDADLHRLSAPIDGRSGDAQTQKVAIAVSSMHQCRRCF